MEEKDVKSRLQNIEKSVISFEKTIARRRDSVLQRFPTLFLFLSTFGLVCILYSLEKMIDTTPLLTHNPYILFIIGASILVITGALYKKL